MLERWVLCVQAFDSKVVYRPGHQNIADSLSRARLKQPYSNSTPEVDAAYHMAKSSVPWSMTARELEQASVVAAELTAVRHCILPGDWSSFPNPAFAHVKNELCVVGKLLLLATASWLPQHCVLEWCRLRTKAIKASPRRRLYSGRKCGGQGWTQRPARCDGRVTSVNTAIL